MLYPHQGLERTSFGFKYLTPADQPIRLVNIGWERVTSPSYRWNGLSRGGGYAVFQFTLAGRGELRWEGTTHSLTKDSAFLVTVPHDHEYYLPGDSEEWEFLYVVVYGRDAINHAAALGAKLGPMFAMKEQAEPVRVLSQLYADLYANSGLDTYRISATLYEWLLELHRMADGKEGVSTEEQLPAPIRAAVSFMKKRYAESLSVDVLAEAAGLTKFHFCRQFQRKTGLSPNQYLRKIRVERAAWLLRHTDKTVESVAKETGFEYANYFIKVFRTFVGATPVEYRLGKKVDPVYFLRIEP